MRRDACSDASLESLGELEPGEARRDDIDLIELNEACVPQVLTVLEARAWSEDDSRHSMRIGGGQGLAAMFEV